MKDELEENGCVIVAGAIPNSVVEFLRSSPHLSQAGNQRRLLAVRELAELARSEMIRRLVCPHMDCAPNPVRAIFFNKTPGENWLVAWHQDVTLAVRERADVPGFGPWTTKESIPHVTAPAKILEGMLTVRIHLDDADEGNGALCVIPGSHRHGKLNSQQIASMRETTPELLCCAHAGDALLMRPLLLHASHKSTSLRQRRVLHLEYASLELPDPLEWHDAA